MATAVRAILFDYGHTLVDFRRTEDALNAAYESIRGRIEAVAYMEVPELVDLVERIAHGIDRMVTQSFEERRMEELNLPEMFRESFAAIGFDLPDDVLQHVVAADHSAYSNSIAVVPSVLDALQDLRERGYRMGLVSNVALLPHLMREDLERLGISQHLDASVFSSELGVRKPDPRIFREALLRLGTEPAETVFVGDRLYDDIGGAHAVGMRAVLTRQWRQEDDPEFEPDAVIDDLGELGDALVRWGGPAAG